MNSLDERQGDVRRSFLPGVAEKLGSYVYLLINPRDGRIFYVGKGKGDRCFAHLHEARTTAADSKGDYSKLRTIRDIENEGKVVRIDVLRHGLDDSTALAVEGAALDLLPLGDNRVSGHGHWGVGRMEIADVNSRYAAEPVTIDPTHRVLLIRISRQYQRGMSAAELYEATRKWWVASSRRTQRVEWVFAVYDGVVRAVFRVEEWETWENGKRLGFKGALDPQMEARYLGRDVSAYTVLGAQNPLRYVNC